MTESPKNRGGHVGKLEAWELEGMEEPEGVEQPEGMEQPEAVEGLEGVDGVLEQARSIRSIWNVCKLAGMVR